MAANLEGSGYGVKTDPDPCIEKKRVWIQFFISGSDQIHGSELATCAQEITSSMHIVFLAEKILTS